MDHLDIPDTLKLNHEFVSIFLIDKILLLNIRDSHAGWGQSQHMTPYAF